MTTHTAVTSKQTVVACLSILAAAFSLAACEAAMPVALQEPIEVRVEGRVLDAETGAPIDSVEILMTSGRIFVDEVGHASAITDAEGYYEVSERFEDECPGDLRVGVAYSLEYQRPESVDLECTDGGRWVSFEITRRDSSEVNSASAD